MLNLSYCDCWSITCVLYTEFIKWSMVDSKNDQLKLKNGGIKGSVLNFNDYDIKDFFTFRGTFWIFNNGILTWSTNVLAPESKKDQD